MIQKIVCAPKRWASFATAASPEGAGHVIYVISGSPEAQKHILINSPFPLVISSSPVPPGDGTGAVRWQQNWGPYA